MRVSLNFVDRLLMTSYESTALSGDMSKLLLAARKIRRATSTGFVISLVADEFSRASNTYVGKLRQALPKWIFIIAMIHSFSSFFFFLSWLLQP